MGQGEKEKMSRSRVLLLLIVAVTAVFAYKCIIMPLGRNLYGKYGDENTMAASPPRTDESSVHIPSDTLNSTHAILVRLSDHAVLMQKNSDDKIYPASLTEIMTAIIAIEKLPDLQEKITLSDAMFSNSGGRDASTAGFQPDEQVRAVDLLYGAMLPNGAECCIGLAGQVAGSEHDFVKMMNEKAAELGMDGTHFENSSGMHDAYHYTTVKDLSALLSYALRNNTFREIFTAQRYSTQSTNKHPEGVTFHSTVPEGLDDSAAAGGKIIGGKTGYTEKAGQCLAGLAEVGGQEYILITTGAKGYRGSQQNCIADALNIFGSLAAE